MIALMLTASLTAQGVIMVTDQGYQGMLCPVSPFQAYTAAHVLERAEAPVWLDLTQNVPLQVLKRDEEADLALVQTTTKTFPFWYEIGQKPEAGAQLWNAGRDEVADGWYIVPSNYVGMHGREMRTTRVLGHQGMSGGCVLDAEGKAVGVFQGWWMPLLEGDIGRVPFMASRGTSFYSRARALFGLKSGEVK